MAFSLGQLVEAHRLKSAVELNGATGVIVTEVQSNGRYGVRFASSSKPNLLKPENLSSIDVRMPEVPKDMPVTREEREGMGVCLVATRAIKAGDVLLAEKACDVIAGTYGSSMQGEMMEWSRKETHFQCDFDLDAVVDHFAQLDNDKLSLIMCSFEAHDQLDLLVQQSNSAAEFACKLGRVPDACKHDLARYIRILSTNAMRIDKASSAIYDWGSKVAHSCQPNTIYQIIPGGVLMLRAIYDTPAGALVTISYLPQPILLLAPTYWRRKVLAAQKEFLCRCERCMQPDTSRVRYCRDCTGQCLREESGTWTCMSCKDVVTDKQMEVEKEEIMMNVVEQASRDIAELTHDNLWKIHDRAVETVGDQHFLIFQLLLHLFKKHLLEAVRMLANVEKTPELQNEIFIFKRRFLVPALLVFRRLEKWVDAHCSLLRYVLLSEAVYKLVDCLASMGFEGDAVGLALQYFSLNRTVYGDHDCEGQAFRQLIAKASVARDELERICLRPGCASEAQRCCERCGLAPYCSISCEVKDRGEHGFLCFTANGSLA